MDFGLLPPEVNSGLMYAGPGAGPMLAAAAGWDSLAAELESTAGGYSSQVAALTGQPWTGPSSAAMAAAAAPYTAWLQASAAQAAKTAAQAYTAAAAYDAAYAMTVPPPVVAENRARLIALVATNFLGQNTPAIAATEAQYAEMWVQDTTAMYGYAATAETASTLKPFDEPPQTTNQTGQADQSRAVAQSAGNAASNRTQSVMQLASSAANDTPVDPGGTISVPPGSTVTVGQGVTVTVNTGATVTSTSGGSGRIVMVGTTVMLLNGNHITLNAGGSITFGPSTPTLTILSGQFTVTSGSITIGNSTITAGSGVTVTSAGGVVTAINSGAITAGVFVPVAPAVTAPSGLGAVTPLLASPGLAGTAGIQPQLNAEALSEFLSGAVPAAAGLG